MGISVALRSAIGAGRVGVSLYPLLLTVLLSACLISTPSTPNPTHYQVCLYKSGITPSQRAFAQLRAYHANGFPSNLAASKGGPGLSEGEWHARDLRAADSTAIGNAWFSEWWRWIKYNLRDQISFNYVIWRLGLLPSHEQATVSATARTNTAAHGTETGKSTGFSHFRAGGGNRSLSPGRSGHRSRALLVHYRHTAVRSLSIEDNFFAEHFGNLNLGWKELKMLKQAHRWCEFLKFGLDNTRLLSKVAALLENK